MMAEGCSRIGVAPAALALLGLIAAPATAEAPTGNATVRGKAGPSEIVITTTGRVAGAIHSLTWNGMEFIDSADHGRQLQSASNLDCGRRFIPEVFNPTEAGSAADGAGPASSSRLLSLCADGRHAGDDHADGLLARAGGEVVGHPAYNDTVLSDHVLTKRVRIGVAGLPHAIEYGSPSRSPRASATRSPSSRR